MHTCRRQMDVWWEPWTFFPHYCSFLSRTETRPSAEMRIGAEPSYVRDEIPQHGV